MLFIYLLLLCSHWLSDNNFFRQLKRSDETIGKSKGRASRSKAGIRAKTIADLVTIMRVIKSRRGPALMRAHIGGGVINIKDWREMRPPAPAPLITYTKYLRRASSRSPRANSSRPLAIAVSLRPLSVIKPSPRLDSLGRPRPLRRAGGARARRAGAARPAAQLAGDR